MKTVRFHTLIEGVSVSGKVSSRVCVCCSAFVLLANELRDCVALSEPAIRSGAAGRPEQSPDGVSFLPIPLSAVSLCIKPLRSTIIFSFFFPVSRLLHRKGFGTRLCRC